MTKISYSEIELIDRLVFKTCGVALSNVATELESQEYFAHTFLLGKQNVKFRVAKITPTKAGQFVTIWKRNAEGITEPFHILDNFDLCIIATRKGNNFGVFIFSKIVLHEKKIISDNINCGKRGIRVYPSWDLATNKQAQKTQLWQTNYFLNLSQGKQVDLNRARHLLI